MLNYVRHDEQFHCTIKLNNGEEIFAKAIITEDDGESVVYMEDPVLVNVIHRESKDGKIIKGLGMSNWMNFSDEDFYILKEKDILTIASLSKEMKILYEMYLTDERSGDDIDIEKYKIDTDNQMGSLGTVEEARRKFEDLFKQ